MFPPLGCGVIFSSYSLSSADKTEEDKDMFECQIHAELTPHENKLQLNLAGLTT